MTDFFDNTLHKVKQAVDNFANSAADIQDYQKEKDEVNYLWYAEKDENYFSAVLENKITRKCLQAIVDKYYSEQVEDILKNSFELSKDSYPTVYNIMCHCAGVLKMSDLPMAYFTNKIKGINALSVEVLDKKMVLLSFKAVAMLNTAEMAFVLGHELGHHQQGNLVCHTVNGLMNNMVKSSEVFGPMLLDAIEVPLKRWCRKSEFNADRAGFLCCGDNIRTVEGLFVKLGMKENVNAYSLYKETGEDHPMLNTRYQRLVEYSKKV